MRRLVERAREGSLPRSRPRSEVAGLAILVTPASCPGRRPFGGGSPGRRIAGGELGHEARLLDQHPGVLPADEQVRPLEWAGQADRVVESRSRRGGGDLVRRCDRDTERPDLRDQPPPGFQLANPHRVGPRVAPRTRTSTRLPGSSDADERAHAVLCAHEPHVAGSA